MRSRPIRFAPASSAIASMRPSTCLGTPEIRFFGAGPSRSGQLRRTMSKLAPMPPEVTITACAVASNSPTASRVVSAPRTASVGASTVPRTPVTTPPLDVSASTRWRNANCTLPAARTRRSNGSTRPGPVPHVMWKRGTELPWPVARPPPRSAQPGCGSTCTPISCSHSRFSPAANST